MLDNKFFRNSNMIVCINFPKQIDTLINKCDNYGIKSIHILVFDINDVDTALIKNFITPCRRRNIHLIIHCFNAKDRTSFKKVFKGIKKNQYFHFQLTKKFKFSYSKEKRMEITRNNIKIYTKTRDNLEEIQEINYGLKN